MEFIRARIQDWPDAQAHSKTRCAVALSIKRSDSEIEFVRVDHDEIRVSFKDNDQRFRFRTPGRVKRDITRNDNHMSVEPWTLVLNDQHFLFEPTRRLHNRTHKNDGRKSHRARPDRPLSYRQ